MRSPGQHPLPSALTMAAAAFFLSASVDLAAQETGGRSQDRGPVATVRGEVVDHDTGDPVRGAAVSLGTGPDGTEGVGTRVTNEEGRFLFREVSPGTYRLSVTILGYQKMADTLHVPSDADLDLVLPLSADPIPLEPIVVEAERRRPGMRDVEDRRRPRSGAFIITREEIEERHPWVLTDVLARVPGARIGPGPAYGKSLLLRGGCRPGIWLDGVRVSIPDGLDRLVSPNDVESIHVYHGFELPVEFGTNPCGGVVIWTRRGTPAPPGTDPPPISGFFRHLAIVAGALLLGILLTR